MKKIFAGAEDAPQYVKDKDDTYWELKKNSIGDRFYSVMAPYYHTVGWVIGYPSFGPRG